MKYGEFETDDKAGRITQRQSMDRLLEDDICGNCGGTGQMDDLIGGKQACMHCK